MLTSTVVPTAADVFARRGWLSCETEKCRRKILSIGRETQVARGEVIYSVGSPPGGVYGVIAGGIAVEGATNWHAPKMAHIFRPGHWFGFGPAVDGGLRSLSCAAIEDSLLLILPLFHLKQMIADDPEIGRLVSRSVNIASEIASWIACDLLISDAARRISAVILRVTGWHEGVEPEDSLGFLLTQTEIGDMANVSRSHTLRILSFLSEQGWIEKKYGHLRIVDGNALSKYAYSSGDA